MPLTIDDLIEHLTSLSDAGYKLKFAQIEGAAESREDATKDYEQPEVRHFVVGDQSVKIEVWLTKEPI